MGRPTKLKKTLVSRWYVKRGVGEGVGGMQILANAAGGTVFVVAIKSSFSFRKIFRRCEGGVS
jgi:hypothetical protein